MSERDEVEEQDSGPRMSEDQSGQEWTVALVKTSSEAAAASVQPQLWRLNY